MKQANGIDHGNGHANGNKAATTKGSSMRTEDWEAGTDHTRWRMKDDRGTQTWHYLESDEEVKAWPQSRADKWYLGMETVCPSNHVQLDASDGRC